MCSAIVRRSAVSGSADASSASARSTGNGAGVGPAFGVPAARSTSSRVTRPPTPVPASAVGSMAVLGREPRDQRRDDVSAVGDRGAGPGIGRPVDRSGILHRIRASPSALARAGWTHAPHVGPELEAVLLGTGLLRIGGIPGGGARGHRPGGRGGRLPRLDLADRPTHRHRLALRDERAARTRRRAARAPPWSPCPSSPRPAARSARRVRRAGTSHRAITPSVTDSPTCGERDDRGHKSLFREDLPRDGSRSDNCIPTSSASQ